MYYEASKIVKINSVFLHYAEAGAGRPVLLLHGWPQTWLAWRQPKWMTSDTLTFIGFLGAVIIAVGYALSNYNLAWIWLASFGFVVNWYGDSLDGTFARVHNQQRKTYGFFIDHNVDCINEALMFIGLGLSPMMNMHIALLVLVAYLILSIYVYISAHLKNEFKLTYAKMGPTELRVIVIIVNTLYFFIRPFQEFAVNFRLFGYDVSLGIMDIVGIIVLIALIIVYLNSLRKDAQEYAKQDPLIKHE